MVNGLYCNRYRNRGKTAPACVRYPDHEGGIQNLATFPRIQSLLTQINFGPYNIKVSFQSILPDERLNQFPLDLANTAVALIPVLIAINPHFLRLVLALYRKVQIWRFPDQAACR